MCQRGSRYVPAHHERAVSPGEIFGDGSGKLEGGRTPTRGPGISAKGPVAGIAGAMGDKARGLIGEPAARLVPPPSVVVPTSPTPAAKSPTSINGMPAIAPAEDSGATSPEVRAQVDSAVAQIQKEVGAVATTSPQQVSTGVRRQVRDLEGGANVASPSAIKFHGTPFQEQLVRDFTQICRDADNMPEGREKRDARRAIRNRLCFAIQRALGLSYVHGDKKKFAQVVRDQLAQRLPPGTDIAPLLPAFMKEWLDGRNLD